MSLSRARRRFIACISLLALVAGTLVPPLAHALAMRAAGPMAADFCSVSGNVPDRAQFPSTPAKSDRHHPASECPCCNATATPVSIADAATRTGLSAPRAVAARHVTVVYPRAPSPWRAIQPRAPPAFA